MSTWDKWWMTVSSTIAAVILALFVLWFANLTQPKVFRGYYLRHVEGRYTIKIDYDNREDAVAFRTYNPSEALEVLGRLQAAGDPIGND